MIVSTKFYMLFFLLFGISNSSFSIEPEDLIMAEALSKPCLSGSMKQEDLMICVSKGYILAQRKLNTNYKVSVKQENQRIRSYLISSQKEWNSSKFKPCYPELENGREGEINFIGCATRIINERNDLLESVFLCDFNKRACNFENDSFIELLSER
ncbi:lysozyme inhibitor LprI family protein [Actinobacillus equuli]|uniref:lysozyme inhibitor LprI family protein n=1 Tax=Actinobacillus equuli TaxID=718 RepID=UPI002441AB9D|nr:lysozyme inhibitor LprI family protein [Actinobacillus equuli]WGE51697.1 lysozyme inhibitor LprI family protein [Actinobacillus equuli subsp. haemolyticus]WGE59987.1 lysozyme inhibitor LprI family protein [Actinobacillus equuli subsp. haemolyticus]WGE61366.1 lysozyme inhibitor LprI family protein [Actinobacillus equuli subsp. haemolyticus]